jgi:cytochrome P450
MPTSNGACTQNRTRSATWDRRRATPTSTVSRTRSRSVRIDATLPARLAADAPHDRGGQAQRFTVPARTDVFVSPYISHRHPRHWQHPDEFDPEHFDAVQVEARHKFIYIPFAAGPRHCIGENFSIHEMMLHLNGATRRFRLRALDGEPVRIEARVNLRPAQDLMMRVERR